MEEDIFQILCMSSESMVNIPCKVKRAIAKEITVHVKKFIEWLCFDDKSHYRCGIGWRIINHKKPFREFNIGEMYQHWGDNVKNK